jgi:SAM-dependent methyltransferase
MVLFCRVAPSRLIFNQAHKCSAGNNEMKKLLNIPVIYQWFQVTGGFFGARVKAISEFLTLTPGMRILDIGCGPGHIVRHLPKGISYVGFDIDQSYIDYANKEFGGNAEFFCKYFDSSDAEKLAGVDVVMMNGVLHHLSDEELETTLKNIHSVLKPGGILFSLDGCYKAGQSGFRRWMLDNDRGKHVRDEPGYRRVLSGAFRNIALDIRENYSRVPYTFVVGRAVK